jgi:glycine betaine/proline transport system substrate-binding protein
MNFINKLISGASILLLGLSTSLFSFNANADCGGRITIAEMNWASAQVLAHIDNIILSEGYGCDTELIPGDTMPTATSLIEKGEPSIAPELWSQNIKNILDPAEAEGRIKNIGNVFENGGEEGFWIPTYMVEKNPELATIDGVLKHPELFPHPEDSSKAALYGCPAGWNCQITTTQMHKAFDMAEAGFEFIDPGSGGALAGAMGEAYNKGEGWFGYYWGPTAILGKYDMTKVDEGVENNFDTWISEINDLNVENPSRNKYPSSVVDTYVGSDILDNSLVLGYLEKRSYNNTLLSQILAWKEENQAEADETAIYFLETQEGLWSTWVSAEAAGKIKSSL